MSVAAPITTAHLHETARLVTEALSPHIDADWSVRAGTLEWSVDRTVEHMVGACAKYTLYLASGSKRYIALSCSTSSGATRAEQLHSIVPVAHGLACVAEWAPNGWTGFHSTGMMTAQDFLCLACEEFLLHTHDCVEGLGGRFVPPEGLAAAVLRSSYPGADHEAGAWRTLLKQSGRWPVRTDHLASRSAPRVRPRTVRVPGPPLLAHSP
jgi:hypothetical protein